MTSASIGMLAPVTTLLLVGVELGVASGMALDAAAKKEAIPCTRGAKSVVPDEGGEDPA